MRHTAERYSRLWRKMKRRILRVALTIGATLIIGIIYAVICKKIGAGIPCPYHSVTGLLCPGCGTSQMCLCLMSLDFSGAVRANAVVLFSLPILFLVTIDGSVRYIKTGAVGFSALSNVCIKVIVIALIVFGVVRNVF